VCVYQDSEAVQSRLPETGCCDVHNCASQQALPKTRACCGRFCAVQQGYYVKQTLWRGQPVFQTSSGKNFHGIKEEQSLCNHPSYKVVSYLRFLIRFSDEEKDRLDITTPWESK
jgi:hypothetical protein